MKSRIRFILCSFIFLSLAGLGEHIFTGFPTIKNIKQTEWPGTNNLNEKDSRSFHYTSWFEVPATHLIIKSWSKESILLYNHKLRAEIIMLTKKADALGYNTALILNNSFIPRRSVEDSLTTCKITA